MAEIKQKDSHNQQLQHEIAQHVDSIGKLNREKKRLEDVNAETTTKLQQEEDKVNHLNKVKSKLEETLGEVIFLNKE